MHNYSKEELSLMGNAGVLLMKRQVLQKIRDDFSKLESEFRNILNTSPDLILPEGALLKAGKISRGENYKGLPYLVLDYPRLMTKDEIFNIRLLFWWGHYYSISLHVAGKAWRRHSKSILASLASPDFQNFYIQHEGSPWEHNVSSAFFSKVGNSKGASLALAERADFIRLINILPLNGVEDLQDFAKSSFRLLLQCFKNK